MDSLEKSVVAEVARFQAGECRISWQTNGQYGRCAISTPSQNLSPRDGVLRRRKPYAMRVPLMCLAGSLSVVCSRRHLGVFYGLGVFTGPRSIRPRRRDMYIFLGIV